MTTDTQAHELRMVRAVDGLDLALAPLQGLWGVEQYLAPTDQNAIPRRSRAITPRRASRNTGSSIR
jgi:hypothetical protein